MRLVLVRHAAAAPGAVDAERPLTPTGEAMMRAGARPLARLDLGIARIVTSPARRCRDSAALVGAALGDARIEVAAELALGASPAAALDRLLDADTATLAVGHAPDLGAIASELLGGEATLWFDCGAAAGLEVEPDGRRAALAWLLPAAVLAALGRD